MICLDALIKTLETHTLRIIWSINYRKWQAFYKGHLASFIRNFIVTICAISKVDFLFHQNIEPMTLDDVVHLNEHTEADFTPILHFL